VNQVAGWWLLGIAALNLLLGTVTLVRKRIVLGKRRRDYDWRLVGWSEIIGGISFTMIPAAIHAPSYGLGLVALLAALVFQAASIGLLYSAKPDRHVQPGRTTPLSYKEWRWWWYDRPISRDWLFWTVLLASAVVFAAMLVAGEFGFPFFLLFPGCLFCAARNLYRGRRAPAGPIPVSEIQ
jgi:hypothetical protein